MFHPADLKAKSCNPSGFRPSVLFSKQKQCSASLFSSSWVKTFLLLIYLVFLGYDSDFISSLINSVTISMSKVLAALRNLIFPFQTAFAIIFFSLAMLRHFSFVVLNDFTEDFLCILKKFYSLN